MKNKMGSEKHKVLLLTNVYAPYRIPIYNLIGNKYELDVIWVKRRLKWNKWEIDLKDSNFRYKTGIGGIFRFISELRNYKIVLFGGYQPLKLLGLLFLVKLFKKKTILWYGLKNREFYHDGFLKTFKKEFVLRFPDMIVTYGTYVTNYLIRNLNVDEKKIITGINIGEVSFFRSRRIVNLIREDNSEKKTINLIMISRLIKNKGILQLLEALSDLGDKDFKLCLVGTGPMLNTIQKKIVSLNIQDKVELTGFVSKHVLADHLSRNDIFVLPTLEDAFSISSSEAISSGLFSLLSRYDNASYDLIKTGENGFVFDPVNKEDLKIVLLKSFELFRSGNLNREKISNSISEYSEKYYSSKIVEALERCI